MRKTNIFMRAGTLLLCVALMTSAFSIAKAKYVTTLPYNTTFYITNAGGGVYKRKGGSDIVTGTTKYNNGNQSIKGFEACFLKAGWWAFALRGGQGVKNSNPSSNGGGDGLGGVVRGIFYMPYDDYVYVCAGVGGCWSDSNGTKHNALYGGGKRGAFATMGIFWGHGGNGGGCTILARGNNPNGTNPSYTDSTYYNYLNDSKNFLLLLMIADTSPTPFRIRP